MALLVRWVVIGLLAYAGTSGATAAAVDKLEDAEIGGGDRPG